MSKSKKEHEEHHDGGHSSGARYETFYDEEGGGENPRWNFDAAGALCGVLGGLRDSVLRTLPVNVTEHLVNSEKELIKAGIAMAESQMRNADDMLNRAKDLNKEKTTK